MTNSTRYVQLEVYETEVLVF